VLGSDLSHVGRQLSHVGRQLLEDVRQGGRRRCWWSNRKTQSVRLTGAVVRILTQNHDPNLGEGCQVKCGEDFVDRWIDLVVLSLIVHESLKLIPIRLGQLGLENWIPICLRHSSLRSAGEKRLGQKLIVVNMARHSGSYATAVSSTAVSSRRRAVLQLLLVLSALAAACTNGSVVEVSPTTAPTTTPTTAVPTTAVPTTTVPTTTVPTTIAADPIEELVAALTVQAKVGQLLMPVLAGTDASTVSEAEALFNQQLGGAATPGDVVRLNELGGVLYLGTNVIDAAQVGVLSRGLQTAAPAGIGLLLAVDQEGGRVNRITSGVTVQPSARSFGGDAQAVSDAAAMTASELSALGINVVLAPVADITEDSAGFIGDRAYGGEPGLVADMVVASIDGLASNGVAAAAKHWPGHGATATDSHRRLPVLTIDEATWRTRERIPFVAAVESGVDIILVGHLAIPALDPSGDPATVSPILLERLLRQELGFDGVVMTDALDMGAVASFGAGELAIRSILAGADVLLVPTDLADTRNALVAAVADGRLPLERLDQSVDRILRLKLRLRLLDFESF
jgi:beta-N-acetylhexosaminidase